MTPGRRLLAMAAFGLGLLFVVVVIVYGFPSLSGNDEPQSAQRPCVPDARNVVLPFGVESAAGRWEQSGPFPIAQDELHAGAIGDVVYVGGGLTHLGPNLVSTDVFYAFNPRRRTYRRLPSLPRRVDHPAFVAAGGDLYLIGGYYDRMPTSDVLRFSPRSGTWTQLASMEVARGSPSAAVIGRRIYVAGGATGEHFSKNDNPTAVLEIFDLVTRRWGRGPDMPTPRHHAGAAASGGALYVVGGRGRMDWSLDTAERFDPRTNRWEQAPALPHGTGAPRGVRANGAVIVIAGGDDSEDWVTPATWAFDPKTSRWSRLADLRMPRHGHAAAAFGDDVYAFGGAPCPGYGLTDSVEKLTLSR